MKSKATDREESNVSEMPNEHLHEPFIDGLKDIYDAEKRLTKALPKMAKAATSPQLKAAIEAHLVETEGHVERLEKVFESIGETAKGKACEAMKGLIEEGEEATECDCDMGRDALIIASAQKVEHYEIATYGTLRNWAEAMGHAEAAALLEETLREEKAADEKLTEIHEETLESE
jgi:ferritin-like metal-binding protein YciE